MNTMSLLLTVKLSEGIGKNEVKKMIADVLHRHRDAAGIESAKVSKPRQRQMPDNVIPIAKVARSVLQAG